MPQDIFLLKLAVSVVVGGICIALQTVLAERRPSLGGVVISVPSTLPLGIFFIGWTHGTETAIESLTIVPIATAILLVFSMIFVFFGRNVRDFTMSRLSANVFSLVAWGLLAIIVVTLKLNGVAYGLFVYAIVLLMAFVYLGRVRSGWTKNRNEPMVVNLGKFPRAVVGGTIIGIAVFLSKVLDPLWGGVFSVFPAAYLSSLNIIFAKGRGAMLDVSRTIPQGSFAFVLYALCFSQMSALGLLTGTLLSELIVLAFLIVMAWIRHQRKPSNEARG